MEAAMAEQVDKGEQETRTDPPIAESASPDRIFRFSTWIHVGAGAEECPGIELGEDEQVAKVTCDNPAHFHAWLRLPNRFQHRDIREKSVAARATMQMTLRREESSSRILVEDDIEELRLHGDLETMIDDLVEPDWGTDFMKAMTEVSDEEDFEHIDAHRERYNALVDAQLALPQDERSEEFVSLDAHITRFKKEIEERCKAIQEPRRQALRDLGLEGVLDQTRELKFKNLAESEFTHTYRKWRAYIGTLARKPASAIEPQQRMFASVDDFEGAPSEVIEAVEGTMTELEMALGNAATGN
jgi:hypothetical protein